MQRLQAAGYPIPDGQALEVVHCQPERYDWLSNGYAMTYADVGGRRTRVLSYAPAQVVQAHVHDGTATFQVTSGAIRMRVWPKIEPDDLSALLSAAEEHEEGDEVHDATARGSDGDGGSSYGEGAIVPAALLELGEPETVRWFWPGEHVTVAAGVFHEAAAHPTLGATVHELVGNFTGRLTVFAASTAPATAVGEVTSPEEGDVAGGDACSAAGA